MIGFSWGVVFGVLSAGYAALIKHDAVEAGESFIGGVITFPLGLAAIALIGYPVYRFALCKSASYRTLQLSVDEGVS
jgi:hypothetical protein